MPIPSIISTIRSNHKILDLALVTLLTIQALTWRLPLIGIPLISDPAIRALVSLEILEGSIPYRDIFNNKPPFILYSGALFSSLLNDPSLGYWFMEITFVMVAAIMIFVMIRKTNGSLESFAFTSLFILFSNVSIYYYFTPGFIEYPAATFTILAYFLTLYGHSRFSHFLAGILVALTLMSHQISLIACAPIWLWLIFHRRWQDLTHHLLGLLIFVGAILTWLYLNDTLHDFIYQVFIFSLFYIKANPSELKEFRLPTLFYLLVPIPFIIMSIPEIIRKNKDSVLILLWLIFASAALLLTGLRLYAHYFVILAPPITLALVYAWSATDASSTLKN